ncbi:MAG: [protein-PII] uridylyltransferase [Desulfobacterota bacterium]|nr:[protein-PII] uridylyltransferase [Thermodesulfobacteriota bacterium]
MPSELGITKQDLIAWRHRILTELPPQAVPEDYLRRHAEMIDGVVRRVFQSARSNLPSPSVCLVAVGGYGRAELAPHSDIDLLLLHSPTRGDQLPSLSEKILYPLWDLGLEVSCSLRSVEECVKMARSDLKVKTSLIDSRYLDGAYEEFRKFYALFTKKLLHRRVPPFAEALARETHLRHKKYEDPAYILEPDLKEGEGGLRDFQAGRWILRAKYKTDRLDSILFPDHSRRLIRSVQFLWQIRNHLHLSAEHRQDRLTFEWQETIAPLLGFPPGPKGVEAMMRQYHLATREISTFYHQMLDHALFEPSFFRKIIGLVRSKRIDDHFGIAGGEIHLLDPAAFKKDPAQLMDLFRYCQDLEAKPDLRTEEAMAEALPWIDENFRTSPRVNETFLSILRKGKGLEDLLRRMHDVGLLSRYIPEFSEIEGRIHYDLYHVHPIDRHTLLAVGELLKLKEGAYQKDHPLLTSTIRELANPEILFLSALLHDIGKGREGPHPLVGSQMARQIGRRMGLQAEEIALLEFLVRHHLLMVETAFRRDLHDEQAIASFAREVQDSTRLKMLYLLTFADIKAVGPEAWNSWKDSLLMELFLKALHYLDKGKDPLTPVKRPERLARLRERVPPEIFSTYAEHLPDRYLATYPPEEIASHLQMAHRLKGETVVMEWHGEAEGRVKVTICTRDRYGLFAKIAGSFYLNRLNILEAQIHTWGDGVALDTFFVQDPTGEGDRRMRQFQQDLVEILNGKVLLKDLFSQRGGPVLSFQKVTPKVQGEVKVNNRDSDFYTIVEITGQDRLGILYEITQALTDFGCTILFARISTLGNQIIDVFYIQDEWGEKITEPNRMDHLKRLLLQRLGGP